ncbi:hypothetical protein MMC12_000076 [Toensbergia leucococca]|nr:hypothetical protein [Toensbergia leucococca]
MSSLAYGLNITKKSLSSTPRPPPAKRKTIFDSDSDPEDGPDNDKNDDHTESITTIDGLTSSSHPKSNSKIPPPRPKPSQKPPPPSHYGDLSTNHTSTKHASSAQSIDPTIYSYDTIYDTLHSKPARSSNPQEKGPKYMANLIAAAETRKRDQLRAQDKMLAKEREAEGDEFADKEKFVTGAYKAQQEEVRRMEAEEAERERVEAERKRRAGGGMTGLYKNILEQDERKHAAVVEAVERAKDQAPETSTDNTADDDPLKSEAALALEKGALTNDDGQVVDKRQLLTAGLNIAPKPKQASSNPAHSSSTPSSSATNALPGRGGAKQAMRERQSRMLEEQLEQAGKRAREEEAAQRGEVERAAKSRKTEGEIGGARERYLARKREAAAAAATGAGDAKEG